MLLRNFVRNRETGLVLVAIVVGLLSGVLVAGISSLSQCLSRTAVRYSLRRPPQCNRRDLRQRTLRIPVLGGLVLALIGMYFARRVKGRQQLADAIEANALYGGRVSFRGSLLISIQTLLSNGFGGSVGLEAGYTQICSMFGSHVGQRPAARRNDHAAARGLRRRGAISAAFSAPLAGAFYAFEVVLGAYTSAGLVPVIASAVTAWLVARHLTHQLLPDGARISLAGFRRDDRADDADRRHLRLRQHPRRCSRSHFSERCFQRVTVLKGLLRPMLGGLLLGGLALLTPTVLGAGHGAMQILLVSNPTRLLLTTTILFRDLGLRHLARLRLSRRPVLRFAAARRADRAALQRRADRPSADDRASARHRRDCGARRARNRRARRALQHGLSPALEITGDFSVTVGAVVASSVCALIVRELFGYSFATWRFHLRGEAIRGPQDIGWVRQMSAASLMRADFENALTTMPIGGEAQGSSPRRRSAKSSLRDPNGIYAGIVARRHAAVPWPARTRSCSGRWRSNRMNTCSPATPVREILKAFERSEADVLAVVDRARPSRCDRHA